MKVDQHLGRIRHMMRIAELGNMVLHDLLDFILQADVERGVDNQS